MQAQPHFCQLADCLMQLLKLFTQVHVAHQPQQPACSQATSQGSQEHVAATDTLSQSAHAPRYTLDQCQDACTLLIRVCVEVMVYVNQQGRQHVWGHQD